VTIGREIIGNIHSNALVAIEQLPRRVENQLADLSGLVEHDFLDIIPRLVVVLVDATEVKNDRNVVLGKVVMI
jgi:hypothetical protein